MPLSVPHAELQRRCPVMQALMKLSGTVTSTSKGELLHIKMTKVPDFNAELLTDSIKTLVCLELG